MTEDEFDWDPEAADDVDELNFSRSESIWNCCPTCGHENEDTDIWCTECGTRLRESTQDDES